MYSIKPLVFIASALFIFSSAVASENSLPANHSLIDNSLEQLQLNGKAAADGKSSIVDVAGPVEFHQAVRVETTKREVNEYELQLDIKLPTVTLKKGDIIWASVWARMLRTEDESGQGKLGLVVEQTKEPFDKLISRRVSVGPTWQQLAAPARVHADAATGSLHLAIRVGGAAQTLEIGGVQLVRFDDPGSIDLGTLPQTRITYGGREPDAAWRADADKRIDEIRKAPLTIRVTDAAGHPISGATVDVEMQQHAFPFGCVYSPRSIAGPDAATPANQEYARRFAELFNVGVDEFAMKWPAWETDAIRSMALASLDWMTAHNIRVRGHCLVWPGWRRLPADVQALQNDPAALAKRIDDHIRGEVAALAGRVTEWDVINEPYVNNNLMKILGDRAMADWFVTAHAADPSPRLLLNETSVPTSPPTDKHYDTLFEQVQAIQNAGAPIGGVGMQAHFGSNLTSINDLQKIYDRFATLGIPLEITELDIDVNDEQLQADYLRDFLTFTFSHPNISGIMMWGFVENHHWRPDAALWREDWKIKPAGQAWLDLVKNKWWTRARLTTSADGTVSLRGFLGTYKITGTANGLSASSDISLPHDGCTASVVLK